MEKPKRAAVIIMGQVEDHSIYADILTGLGRAEIIVKGILDGMTIDDVMREAWPKDGEAFIVTNLADGTNVRIAESQSIARACRCIEEAEAEGAQAALVLCTGHFELPLLPMPVLIPERVIFSLLDALRIQRLGTIVPEAEQIPKAFKYYERYNPIIRAASPYGSRQELIKTAAMFGDDQVDLILTDCMGFTEEMGAAVSRAANKQVFVPRVVLPALLNSLLC